MPSCPRPATPRHSKRAGGTAVACAQGRVGSARGLALWIGDGWVRPRYPPISSALCQRLAARSHMCSRGVCLCVSVCLSIFPYPPPLPPSTPPPFCLFGVSLRLLTNEGTQLRVLPRKKAHVGIQRHARRARLHRCSGRTTLENCTRDAIACPRGPVMPRLTRPIPSDTKGSTSESAFALSEHSLHPQSPDSPLFHTGRST